MIRRKRIVLYINVVIRFIYVRLYVEVYICDLKHDWLQLNGVNVFVCCLCMYVSDNPRELAER